MVRYTLLVHANKQIDRPIRTKPISCAMVIVMSLGLLLAAQESASQTAADDEPSLSAVASNTPSKIRSAEDGWLDISGFLDQAYGFVPIVMPITEPAVGYGAAGTLAFIDKPKGEAEAGFGRPNISIVGGLLTENNTKGVVAGDVRHWLDEHLQTLVGGINASVNLDFYGVGKDVLLRNNPLSYNLETLAGVVQAKYRFGNSKYWAGLGYALATTKVKFNGTSATSFVPDLQRESRVGGLIPSLTYDSRDNIFTPIRGTYIEASAGLFSQALGSDGEFQRANLIAMHFMPLHPKLTLGVRGGGTFSFGDVPFYMRPFIQLRGAPVMRYQGDNVAQVEAELRWQFWQRFSLVGFAGTGVAWNDFERFNRTLTVVTGGAGFRYELARKYGLHMGLDVATGPAGQAIYVQFGSAWIRP
jgi:hypothetical protein